MTTISITFVICLSEFDKSSRKSRPSYPNNKVSIAETEEESTTSVDLKCIEETPFETSTKYVIYVEKPSKSLQIDYEIIPKLTYNVDVLFWGNIAKIITKEKILSVRTITKLKNTFITFTIEHKIMLDVKELMLYNTHIIPFNMRLEKSGNITNVPVPESSTFFFLNEDVELKCIFTEVFEYVPTNEFDEISRAEVDVKLILQEIMNFGYKGEILHLLKLPDVNNRKKILNIINWFVAKKDYECYNSHTSEGVKVSEILNAKPPTSLKKKADNKESIKKPEKKGRKSSASEINTFQLNVPGQVLFTDPNMTVFNFPKRSKDMKCAYIILNVKNFITSKQKSILNPVLIKLNKLINVPVEQLSKQRFEYLYLTYNLCGFPCTTTAKQITNTIYYKNHKIIFLEKKVIEFAQQAQKDYLIVKINGIRNCLVTKETEIFGTNPQDKFLSVPMRNKKQIEKYSKLNTGTVTFNESVLVAIACLKLNPLLSTFKTFFQTEQCIHPSRCPIPLTLTQSKSAEELNAITINAINSPTKQTDNYPLSEDILLDSELCVVVKMELHKSINKLLDRIVQKEIFFNRIILVTGHGDLAKYILSNVFTHNSCWIYKDDVVPPNYLPNCESTTDLNNVNIISGFSIDNGDIFIMFLEGNAKWVKNILWQHIKNESFTCAKILYNSDYVYKDRIYTSLIPYGGVYNITLHSSLKAILDSSRLFSPGYLPEPTRRAFAKIDMILKSQSLNEITINMLPTKKELFSLDVEWGVPIHWPLTEQQQQQ